MPFEFEPIYAVYLLIAVAVTLAIEAVFLMVSRKSANRRQVNQRLQIIEETDDREEALRYLRRKRGLTDEGRYALPLIRFNRLILQSGIGWGTWRVIGGMCVLGAVMFLISIVFLVDPLTSLLVGLFFGFLVPLMILKRKRTKRHLKFSEQLPDAIDIIVRSLRAGHPVPVAIAMVAREMQDPVGSEFGIAADEMTYGLDFEIAMRNLMSRVGQEDLGLLVVAVTIQTTTGGNLGEILNNLSTVLRDRFKMRRKVRALSAEGRFSGLALSLLPIILFIILNLIAPSYYGKVWNDPITKPILGIGIVMMLIGDYIMYKMVNFKF